MPTSISQGFQQLKVNLEITSLQSATASARQQNVRAAVEKHMTVLNSFLTGSYRRSTMIAPLAEADVDVFVVLDSSYFEQNGQAALLDKLKRALAKEYNNSTISRAGQAVTIRFTDFYVDVVPAFNRQGGGYLIPDSILKRWISTDPTKHVSLWSELNSRKDGKFVPLVKMLKGWNKEHSQLLRSFHLETLAYDVLNSVTITDYPSGVRYFFDHSRAKIVSGTFDPAGYGGNVGAYLDTQQKRDDVVTRLKAAYDKALEAERFERDGYTKSAYSKWQVIFGDYFPHYG